MLIAPSRPKYLCREDFEDFPLSPIIDCFELFFDSGRSAMFFFLQALCRERGDSSLRVVIQSFNCSAVMEAVLQAGCQPVVVDIKPTDFSIALHTLEILRPRPDVVILTHYQGIPNEDYLEIAQWCQTNDVVLLDDLAQTEGSQIEGTPVGTLGMAAVHSFYFDKPFTAMRGGSLTINNITSLDLVSLHAALPLERMRDCVADFKMLRFLFDYTQPQCYHPGLDKSQLIRFLLRIGWREDHLNTLLKSGVATKAEFMRRVWLRLTGSPLLVIQPRRARPERINLVCRQRGRFQGPQDIELLLRKVRKLGGIFATQKPNMTIAWNRFSALDPSGRVRQWLTGLGVSAANFNWALPLHRLYQGHQRIEWSTEKFPHSDEAARLVLNIPIWQDFWTNNEF